MAINLAIGLPLAFIKLGERKMYSKEGFCIVALSWIALSTFGALPFVLSGSIPSFVDAFFETDGYKPRKAKETANTEQMRLGESEVDTE